MESETLLHGSLRPHPKNPRRGDVAAIKESLRRFGQTKPIVVARDGTILAGTHTWRAAGELDWTEVMVVRQDLDPFSDEALAIMRDDNETADAAGYDERFLFETLSELPELGGTGFSPDDVDDLRILYGDEPFTLPPEPPDETGRRVMILTLPIPVFLWLNVKLEALAATYGVTSNTAAILRAVADKVGEPLPAGLEVQQ